MKVNYEFLKSLSQPIMIELLNGDRRLFDLTGEAISPLYLKNIGKNIRLVESSSGEGYYPEHFLEKDEELYNPKDEVNHPPHYTQHPSGVECIQVTEHMGFNLGNAVKYIWRADLKHDDPTKDLEKAEWYIKRELLRLKNL